MQGAGMQGTVAAKRTGPAQLHNMLHALDYTIRTPRGSQNDSITTIASGSHVQTSSSACDAISQFVSSTFGGVSWGTAPNWLLLIAIAGPTDELASDNC